MTNVQPSKETRLHILAARQAALTEVLEQFNRLTIAAREEAFCDGGSKALERSWRGLHHWLAEAGRENQIELALLRHEMATTIDQADVAPKAKHSRSTSSIFSRFRSTLMSS